MTKKVALIQSKLIIRRWAIDGYPNYFFSQDKQLYRFDTRGCIKRNERVVIGTTHSLRVNELKDTYRHRFIEHGSNGCYGLPK